MYTQIHQKENGKYIMYVEGIKVPDKYYYGIQPLRKLRYAERNDLNEGDVVKYVFEEILPNRKEFLEPTIKYCHEKGVNFVTVAVIGREPLIYLPYKKDPKHVFIKKYEKYEI